MEGDKTKKSKGIVKDYNDMSTDKKVDVEIIFNEPIDESMDPSGMYNKLEKTLKLYTTQSTNNMHLFNHQEKLSKYEEVEDILNAYVPVRLDYYQKRKHYQIQSLEKELKLLSNKAKYIEENLEGTIDLRNKKKDVIIKMLEDKSYDKLDDDNDYKYLLKMPMDSVSEENSEK
jgi:DNA topoisomerase-2